jgi:hypothetical protein
MSDDESETSPAVIVAVATSVAPLPFLAVYATLFIARGGFRPVNPPDITTTPHGELGAGFVALALFVLGTLSIFWYMNGRRRWLFVLGQVATLATAIHFITDSNSGPAGIPILLIATSAVALLLCITPSSSAHIRAQRPQRSKRRDPATRAAERAASSGL